MLRRAHGFRKDLQTVNPIWRNIQEKLARILLQQAKEAELAIEDPVSVKTIWRLNHIFEI